MVGKLFPVLRRSRAVYVLDVRIRIGLSGEPNHRNGVWLIQTKQFLDHKPGGQVLRLRVVQKLLWCHPIADGTLCPFANVRLKHLILTVCSAVFRTIADCLITT